jgi:hypothetical protein
VPEKTEQDLLPAEVQSIIQQLEAIYPAFPMCGTITYAGRKLIHVNMLANFKKEDLEELFTQFELDWIILSIRDTIEPYLQEYLASKVDFIPFYQEASLATPIYLSCYMGTDPLEL